MRGRGDFKSQILSSQKPRKRRTKASRSRDRVDLIELHRNIVEAKRQRRSAKSTWIKGMFFALIAVLCFFLLGCLIAALSVPMWAKILLFTFTAVLGLVSSYIVTVLFHWTISSHQELVTIVLFPGEGAKKSESQVFPRYVAVYIMLQHAILYLIYQHYHALYPPQLPLLSHFDPPQLQKHSDAISCFPIVLRV